MGYPVTLTGGTDELRLTPDGRVYHVGERIDDLSDAQRTHLQGNGIRFAAVHEEPTVAANTVLYETGAGTTTFGQIVTAERAEAEAVKTQKGKS